MKRVIKKIKRYIFKKLFLRYFLNEIAFCTGGDLDGDTCQLVYNVQTSRVSAQRLPNQKVISIF